jgi:hypothetical protein
MFGHLVRRQLKNRDERRRRGKRWSTKAKVKVFWQNGWVDDLLRSEQSSRQVSQVLGISASVVRYHRQQLGIEKNQLPCQLLLSLV